MEVCDVTRLVEELEEQMYINVRFHNNRSLNEGLELAIKIVENQQVYIMEDNK